MLGEVTKRRRSHLYLFVLIQLASRPFCVCKNISPRKKTCVRIFNNKTKPPNANLEVTRRVVCKQEVNVEIINGWEIWSILQERINGLGKYLKTGIVHFSAKIGILQTFKLSAKKRGQP